MNKDKSNFKYVSENDFIRGSYIKIPKALYIGEKYKSLSNDAILLYGILLDRFTLSTIKNIRDKEGRVYVVASVECIMKMLNIGKDKSRSLINELDKLDLIKIEKMSGFNNNRRLYLGEVIKDENKKLNNNGDSNKSTENQPYGGGKISTTKGGYSNPNNTNINNTYFNNRKNKNKEKSECSYSYLEKFNFDY